MAEDYLSPGGGYLSSTDEFSDEEEAVGEKLKRSRQCRERVHKSREKGYYTLSSCIIGHAGQRHNKTGQNDPCGVTWGGSVT